MSEDTKTVVAIIESQLRRAKQEPSSPPPVRRNKNGIPILRDVISKKGTVHRAKNVEDCINRPQPRTRRFLRLIEREGDMCVYCGKMRPNTIDHVTPECLGGDSDPDNLVASCWKCNTSKGGRSPLGWLMRDWAVARSVGRNWHHLPAHLRKMIDLG